MIAVGSLPTTPRDEATSHDNKPRFHHARGPGRHAFVRACGGPAPAGIDQRTDAALNAERYAAKAMPDAAQWTHVFAMTISMRCFT